MFFDWFGRLGPKGALLALTITASCTVKEDRSVCPCLLAISLSAPGPADYRLVDSEGAVLKEGSVTRDTVLQIGVPRSGVKLLAVAGAQLSDGVRIPLGSQCPPLYLFCSRFGTDYESLLVNAVLKKHFCQLHLVLDGPPGDGKPVEVMVRGEVDGVGSDGRPSAGSFRCSALQGLCRLPRQAPGDRLWLDIVMEDRVVRTFALGTYIREAGYDWTQASLDDITIYISLSVTQIRFRIQDWSLTVDLNVEI